MKISNSKKELASIISENGGWRDGAEWSIQDRDKNVEFMTSRPEYMKSSGAWCAHASRIGALKLDKLLPNWHQTILSRGEYFHLYPEQDAGVSADFNPCMGRFETGGVMAPHVDTLISETIGVKYTPLIAAGPTIEQLAADYRNAKDYADRKQQEADDAKADAEVKLKALEIAGEALGLVLSVATPEPELVITDWRDLKVGDEIEYLDASCSFAGLVGTVELIDYDDREHYHILFRHGDRGASDNPVEWMSTRWCSEFRFIRRP